MLTPIAIGVAAGALTFGILVFGMVKLSDYLEALNDDRSGFADGDYPHIPCWSDPLFHNGTDKR